MKSTKPDAVLLDKKQALAKAEHFCAYQERSQQELRYKLLDWGLRGDLLEEVLSELIIGNFLNEERFAHQYVSGKFNIKKWGRLKIKQGLKQKGVPAKLIQKALYGLNDDDYLQTLTEIAQKKHATLTEKDKLKKQMKLVAYLQSRGFETDLILVVLKNSNLN